MKNMSDKEWVPFLWGTGLSLVSGLILLSVLAWVLTLKDVSDGVVTVLSYFVLIMASFVGGWVCSRRAGKRGLKAGGIIGIIVFLVLAVISVIANGFVINPHLLIKGCVSCVGGMVGGVVGVNALGKRKMKMK